MVWKQISQMQQILIPLTALASITTSMGHVSGHLASLQAFGDVSSSVSAIEIQSMTRLMDTNFAVETAKLLKNSLISSYAHYGF